MTVAGVRSLLSGFSPLPPPRSKWLIGLDDFVTQPGALDVIFAIPGAEVRLRANGIERLVLELRPEPANQAAEALV